MAQKKQIGFIGLGAMGKPMARNLLAAEYELTVYDIDSVPMAELVDQGAVSAGVDVPTRDNGCDCFSATIDPSAENGGNADDGTRFGHNPVVVEYKLHGACDFVIAGDKTARQERIVDGERHVIRDRSHDRIADRAAAFRIWHRLAPLQRLSGIVE